jgi:hypothetical protein
MKPKNFRDSPKILKSIETKRTSSLHSSYKVTKEEVEINALEIKKEFRKFNEI